MFFDEPKVELIVLDMSDMVTSQSCDGEASSQTGGGDDCKGCDARSNNCTREDIFMIDKPTNTTSASKAKAVSAPKNIVGFDMTFDK